MTFFAICIVTTTNFNVFYLDTVVKSKKTIIIFVLLKTWMCLCSASWWSLIEPPIFLIMAISYLVYVSANFVYSLSSLSFFLKAVRLDGQHLEIGNFLVLELENSQLNVALDFDYAILAIKFFSIILFVH